MQLTLTKIQFDEKTEHSAGRDGEGQLREGTFLARAEQTVVGS